MRLYEEIFKNTDAAARYSIIVGGGGYFEGVKTVGDFSSQKIVLFFPRNSVKIEGENLTIRKYCEGDLELSGKIHSVTVLDSCRERTEETPSQGQS